MAMRRLPMSRDVFSADGVRAPRTESPKPSPKTGEGVVCVRWVRCGKAQCRCMHDGPKHGPYYARYWWQDGRRYKRYVRQQDATTAVTACSVRRKDERDQRDRAQSARQEWRALLALIRE